MDDKLMVEAVAKAIYNRSIKNAILGCSKFEDLSEDSIQYMMENAEAAIEAMQSYKQSSDLPIHPASQAVLCPVCGGPHPAHYANCSLNQPPKP